MTNPFETLIDKAKAELHKDIAAGFKVLHIAILEEDAKSVLSRLSVLVLPDQDRAARYLRLIAYMESDGTGSIGVSDASPTTPPPQRPPDTTP